MSVLDLASSAIGGVKNLPRRMFGTRNDRLLKTYARVTSPIGGFEPDLRGDFDERFAEKAEPVLAAEMEEEEREAALQAIRVELSDDLRTRSEALRERISELIGPLDDWWNALPAEHRVDEYYRKEYRKRNEGVIAAMDESGASAEAFAVLREASRRAQAHRHFDCQLIGGRVLFEGKIAEMRTGEGKTIVCHLAAFANVLCGRKVHIITVNDYLVKRDAEFAAPIFELCGISVGYIQSMVDPSGREGVRRAAYLCDITYGTNAEFGFDYLRDNMKTHYEDQVQGPLDFVIVDEVDSILIDEARTPLIISGSAHDDVTRYPRANKVAEDLVRAQNNQDRKLKKTIDAYDGDERGIPKLDDAMRILGYYGGKASKLDLGDDEDGDAAKDANETAALGPDFLTDDHVEAIQIFQAEVMHLPAEERYKKFFIIHIERKQAGLTHDGVTVAQDSLDVGSLYAGANMEWPHLIENALRAHKVYQRDKDYVVQDGQIVIVDPFTGRLMQGRQWSDGLHQACEAKENVRVKEETQTLATITIQNFVKLYKIKAGMTGTALTEANEFDKIYQLEVIEIPTNRPVNRLDHNDKMYRSIEQKYGAIVDEIHEIHRRGRPADPYLMADIFKHLKPIAEREGKDTSKIDEALRQFNTAEFEDPKVIQFMLEVYDELLGDLLHGRPVLVGTTSVEDSEKLSKLLEKRYGIEHEVLNAKNHAREAEIVLKAGHLREHSPRDKSLVGNVTIATNMAGRGTDIKLGLNVVHDGCRVPKDLPEGTQHSDLYPIGITKCCIQCTEYDAATNCAHCWKPKLDPRFPDLGRKVCALNSPCGLHIIGTERHEARRIDNQLRGRAGRQGDPGSSRFSLSLEDDLLKLFMPDWMLKMMEKLGFTEGASLEDKRLSKGIERAQRKVEERNFSTRKSLLEWDEPMDFQRREFYGARQQILEERELPELIFETIEQTIRSTVTDYLGGAYDRKCIAEWCRAKAEITIEPEVIDSSDIEFAIRSIRTAARDEAHDSIRTSIGEYIDEEEPAKNWDVGGLLAWANRQFELSATQNQLRKMDPRDIERLLTDAADAHVDGLDLSPISAFLEDHFAARSLAEWATEKFNIELALDDVLDKSIGEVTELIHSRVREAYNEREISYPVEWCIDRFLPEETDQAAAAEQIVRWANGKYEADFTVESIQALSKEQIRESLMKLAREAMEGGLAEQIDAAIAGRTEDEQIAWAKERFGRAWNQRVFDSMSGDTAERIHAMGREMLRWELTRLEHFVLLRIYDQAWKDHLLEMDHLKTAIMQRPLGGDQTHPQSQFAIEGRDLFTQMWNRIAERVTDMIFKVRVTPSTEARQQADQQQMQLRHGDSTGGGFAGATADQAAAMRAQNVDQKTETIRREQPKVGRNDPCPCGSGKKFKACHGRAQ